jgi:hypothetical protein
VDFFVFGLICKHPIKDTPEASISACPTGRLDMGTLLRDHLASISEFGSLKAVSA